MNIKELGERLGLDEDEYRELLELFRETGGADFETLTSALAAGDAQQVARSAHTISGAAGNMGIMNIHEAAKRIELAANDGCLEAVADDVKTLGEGLEAISAALG
jgi:HPt (histidine-containing phosphotransfer) domain-containing protein